MWKLKAVFLLIFIAVLIGLGMVVSADNSEMVSPILFGMALPQNSFGIWLFISLLTGGFLGFGIAWLSWIKNVGQNRMLTRKLKSREQELTQLRTSALRD